MSSGKNILRGDYSIFKSSIGDYREDSSGRDKARSESGLDSGQFEVGEDNTGNNSDSASSKTASKITLPSFFQKNRSQKKPKKKQGFFGKPLADNNRDEADTHPHPEAHPEADSEADSEEKRGYGDDGEDQRETIKVKAIRTGKNIDPVFPSDTRDWRRMAIGAFMCCFCSIGVSIILGIFVLFIGTQPPRVDTKILTLDYRENTVATLTALELNQSAQDLVLNTMICQYVIARNGIRTDIGHMMSTWGRDGFVDAMSSPKVWDDFTRNFFILGEYEENGYHRYVDLLGEPILHTTLDGIRYYRLDYRSRIVDITDPSHRIIDTQYWTAALSLAVGSKRVLEGKARYSNPLGLEVLSYSDGELLNRGLEDTVVSKENRVICGRGINWINLTEGKG